MFEVGDKVVCINDKYSILWKDKCYIIKTPYSITDDGYLNYANVVLEEHPFLEFSSSKFKSFESIRLEKVLKLKEKICLKKMIL